MLTIIYFTSKTYASVIRFRSETLFVNPVTQEKLPFPTIEEKSSLDLSVVVPAYNEEKRRNVFEILKNWNYL